MRPVFKSDIDCVREEKRGIVFYRLALAGSETSFRLYEIEYLIAQCLDGTRDPDAVIEFIESEYAFELSRVDLDKLLLQFDSMGFFEEGSFVETELEGSLDVATSAFDGLSTSSQVTEDAWSDLESLERMGAESEVVASAQIVEKTSVIEASENTEFQLVGTPGLVGPAESVESVEPVEPVESVESVESVEPVDLEESANVEASDNSEIEPESNRDSVEQLSPFGSAAPDESVNSGSTENLEGGFESSQQPAESHNSEAGSPQPSGALQIAVIGCVLATGLVALVWASWFLFWAQPEFTVRTQVLQASRLPIFFEETPSRVAFKADKELAFTSSGIIEKIFVKQGKLISKGDVVAALRMPKRLSIKYTDLIQNIESAQTRASTLAEAFEDLFEEQTRLSRARQTVREKVQGYSTRSLDEASDIRALKKEHVSINNKLSAIAQRERRMRRVEKRIRSRIQRLRKTLARFYRAHGKRFIIAPFSGRVVSIHMKLKQRVKRGQRLIRIIDESEWKLSFDISPGSFHHGGRVFVSTQTGALMPGVIRNYSQRKERKKLVVILSDFSWDWGQGRPHFRLVREFIELAYQVPLETLVQELNGFSKLYVVRDGKAIARQVMVEDRKNNKAIIRAQDTDFRDNEHFITELVTGESLDELEDGQAVTVTEVFP